MSESVQIGVDVDQFQFPYKVHAGALLDFSALKEVREITPYDISVLSQLLQAGSDYVSLEGANIGILGDKGFMEDLLALFYGTSCINVLGRLAFARDVVHPSTLFPSSIGLKQSVSLRSSIGSLSFKEEVLFDLVTDMSYLIGEKVAKSLAALEPFSQTISYTKIRPPGIGNYEYILTLVDRMIEAFTALNCIPMRGGQNVIFAGEEFLKRLERLPGYVLLCRGTKKVIQARGILTCWGSYVIVDGAEVVPSTKAYCLWADDLVEKRTLSFETSCPLRVEYIPSLGTSGTKCLTLVGEVRIPNDFPFVTLSLI